MTKTFYGIDNEFAVATGSNVNDAPGQSSFDNPPNSSRDLIIISNAGDSDPNLFELGETYDVQYSGPGGTTILEDAVVIRSDPAPGDGGIIVFEGANGDGDPAQVVWSPDFDLETWYFDNFTNGQPPKFFASDQNTSYTHTVNCFAASTLLETPSGPRPVEHLRPNDRVLTRNDGARRILWTGARTMPGDGPACPVRFAPGTLGNTRPCGSPSSIASRSDPGRPNCSSARPRCWCRPRRWWVNPASPMNRAAPSPMSTFCSKIIS